MPFILRRRIGLREMFIAIYDYSGDGSAVKDVKILTVHDSTGAIRSDAAGMSFGQELNILFPLTYSSSILKEVYTRA